jgi:hypothetical protein
VQFETPAVTGVRIGFYTGSELSVLSENPAAMLELQAASQLLPPVEWITLRQTTGSFWWSDSEFPSASHRFYRIKEAE